MSVRPHISVVLANYNGERYLRECVESVLTQTYENFEFLVVDDGSTDGSVNMITSLANANPGRIQLLRLERNVGQGFAFNQGVAVSQGSLVSFLDSDDIWFPHKLETVVATFGDDRSVVLHQHQLAVLRDGKITDENVRPTLIMGDVLAEAKRTGALPGFVPTSGLTFSRRGLDEVLPVPADFRVCADGYLTRTTMCFGRVSATDRVCGAYRAHAANATFGNSGFNMLRYFAELLYPQLNRFYSSRGIALAFNVDQAAKPQLDLLRLTAGDRVVVMRSAPVKRVQCVLEALFERFPDVRVDLLVQPGFADDFADHRIEKHVLPAGFLAAGPLPPELRRHFSSHSYACALVPYSDVCGASYENVHAALQHSNLECPIVGIGLRGAFYPVGAGATPVSSSS